MLYDQKNPHGGDIYAGQVRLDFSANTNPFGTPPGVLAAVEAALPQVHRYPDPYCRRLVSAISAYEQVPEDWILCGNGAADLIYAFARAVGPGLGAETAPTFSEYALGLARTGSSMARYGLAPDRDFALDEGILDFLRQTRPKVLFLCNPNNPTGRLIEPELLGEVLEVCRGLGIRLFLDECFLSLSQGGISMKPLLDSYHNLILLKAFTKSYGMAGLRLGYCLSADRALLGAMSRESQPWNVSGLAQAAGTAALKETAFLEKTRALLERERPGLARGLEKLGFRVIPSRTNYLLFQGAPGLEPRLRDRGILIRNCENYEGLCPGWYRIAVRLPEENRALLRAIGEEV